MSLDTGISPEPVRLVLADRQLIFRRALHTALTNLGWEYIEEVTTVEQLWERLERPEPTLLFLDQHLSEQPLIPFSHDLLAQVPELRLLLLVAAERATAALQLEALQVGAVGCVSKEHPPEFYCDIAHQIALGRSIFQHTTIRLALGERTIAAIQPHPHDDRLRELTERELEVLKLLAQGLANPDIASVLQITENTVMKHVSNLMGKLHARNRREASLIYLRNSDPLLVRTSSSKL